MSFAEWKKKTKLFDGTTIIASSGDSLLFHDHVNGIAQAAYKAGERQGRKDEREFNNELAKRAIELRALLDAKL